MLSNNKSSERCKLLRFLTKTWARWGQRLLLNQLQVLGKRWGCCTLLIRRSFRLKIFFLLWLLRLCGWIKPNMPWRRSSFTAVVLCLYCQRSRSVSLRTAHVHLHEKRLVHPNCTTLIYITFTNTFWPNNRTKCLSVPRVWVNVIIK